MKKLFPIFFLAFAACKTEREVQPAKGPFIRYFGSEYNYTAVLALESQHGFALLANMDIQSSVIGQFDKKIKFFKTDADGNLLWEKSYPAFGESGSMSAASFLSLEDEGYIIIGDRINNDGSTSMQLLRIDTEGSVQITKTLSVASASLHGHAVMKDVTGDFIVLGSITGNSPYNVYLAKVKSGDLSLEWEKKYPSQGTLMNRLYTSVSQNILWGSSVATSSGNNDVRLIHAPQNSETFLAGNLIGNPSLNENALDFCQIVGGYAITGVINEGADDNIYLARVTNQFEPVFTTKFDFNARNDKGVSICPATDGGLVILGTVESETDQEDLYLVKTDGFGNLIWHYNYGGTDNQQAASVRPLQDGSYLLFGTTYFTSPGVRKLILMKVNRDGKL